MSPAPSSRPEAGPRVTIHRTWLPLAITALIIGAAFNAVYLGIQASPTPQQLPLAVVGAPLTEAAGTGLGDTVALTAVSTRAEGVALVRDGEVIGVVAAPSPAVLQFDYAGSKGLSESGAARQLVAGLAAARGSTVQESDIVPLTRYDSRGLASFYVVFGVTLSSFILAQLLSSGGAVFGRLRHKLLVILGFSVTTGVVATAIAGPVYGALPPTFVPVAVTLTLLSAAVALATTALAVWLGPPGISVAVLLFTVVGNATSGASIGFDLLPDWARTVSAELPTGAAVRALTDYGYFAGSNAAPSIAILVIWSAAGLALVLARTRLTGRRGRQGGEHPGTTPTGPPALSPT